MENKIDELIKEARDAALFSELARENTSETLGIDHRLKEQDLFDRELQREMRESVKQQAFLILVIELAALGVVVFLQGFKLWGFNLNDWVFGTITSGCLLQTFGIIRNITLHLFPNESKNRFKTTV